MGQVVSALSGLMGLEITGELLGLIVDISKPIIDSGRSLARDLAYEDYLRVVGGNPVPRITLARFTDDLWNDVLDGILEDHDFLDEEVLQRIGMEADHWSRDAEAAQKLDSAKNDPRVGRIARVDPEPPSCPFCTLLNSRGPVYLSEETVSMTFHAGDECEWQFVPRGYEDSYPGKDSVDQAKALYEKVTKAGASGAKEVLKALAELDPNRPDGRVKTTTQDAVADAANSQIRATRSRLETLERLNPETDAGRSARDEQITRDQDILSVLETT